jgi:caa(3)-type oxidase subunit IV
MAVEAAMDSNPAHAEHSGPSYIAVFIYLIILTGIELLVYALNFPTDIKIGLLLSLAMAKAVLVAMYFMHLASEHVGLWLIAVTPIVLVGFCYLMLRPDLSARAWAHSRHTAPVASEPAAAPPS